MININFPHKLKTGLVAIVLLLFFNLSSFAAQSSGEAGLVVPEDKALKLLEAQANEGYPAAQVNLGLQEMQIHKNYPRAAFWFEKAAAQGYPGGQYYLGLLYYSGFGLEKNPAEAGRLYLLAAQQGLQEAQDGLYRLYKIGAGLDKDLVRAYVWCSLAWAKFACGDLHQRLSPEQLVQAEKLIEEQRDLIEKNSKTWSLVGHPKIAPIKNPE